MVDYTKAIDAYILPMTSGDVEQVKKLELECKLSPWSLEDYTNEIKRESSISLVAKKGDLITGFAIARLVMSGVGTIADNKFNELELCNIAVKTEFRNLGIGRELMRCLLSNQKAEHVSEAWLELRKSNHAAAYFYKELGFANAYSRKRFYRAPAEDAVVMRLTVSDRK